MLNGGRDWLARTVEEPIQADLPICDPHHHLWDLPGDRYQLAELRQDTGSGHRIETTVFVECGSAYRPDGPEALRPVGETVYAADQAAASADRGGARIAGIVAFADLMLGGAVEEVLVAHERAGGGRFRGVRHRAAWDADRPSRGKSHLTPPGLLGRPDFRQGIGVLARLGYRFDAWVYHPQLPEVTDLARAFPELPIVVDHLGGPLGSGRYAGRRAEVRAEWRRSMAELAGCGAVTVKLGGIGMEAYGLGWEHGERPPTSEQLAEAWTPEIEFCIEQFGAGRCMFESNFPVDRQSTSYLVLWNAFKRMAAGVSPSERAALFHDTATRFYGLA